MVLQAVTACGVQPVQPVQPKYESYWLYGAVEPKTGEAFYLEMPWLNADAFSLFLKEMARAYSDGLNILLGDGAGAHRAANVIVPKNMVLMKLPAYSPEINTVERLWLDVKKKIDVFDPNVRASPEALKNHIADILKVYTCEKIQSLTGYDYILDAVNAQ